MTTFYCPLCQSPLKRRARKEKADQYFWTCTGYAQGCTFVCDDCREEPYLKTCPECGNVLSFKVSSRTQRSYVACFNKTGHASKEVRFFREDGTAAGEECAEDQPRSKGIFTCPECHGVLLYRRVRSGKYAGLKNVFLCPSAAEHKDGKTHFFEDNAGQPLL